MMHPLSSPSNSFLETTQRFVVCVKIIISMSLPYVWGELTTPKLGEAYSQQPLGRFSPPWLRGVLQCLNRSTQQSERRSARWLLRISFPQFLHRSRMAILVFFITRELLANTYKTTHLPMAVSQPILTIQAKFKAQHPLISPALCDACIGLGNFFGAIDPVVTPGQTYSR